MSIQRSNGPMPRTGPGYGDQTGGVPPGKGPGYGGQGPAPQPVRPTGLPKSVERPAPAPKPSK